MGNLDQPISAEAQDPDAHLGPIVDTLRVHVTLRSTTTPAPVTRVTLGPIETTIEQALQSTFPGLTAKATAEHT